MALTFGYYASADHAREFAVGAVLILTAVNYLGIRKTAIATRIILFVVLLSLAVVVFAALNGGAASFERLKVWDASSSVGGILQATGMIFSPSLAMHALQRLGKKSFSREKRFRAPSLLPLDLLWRST